MLNVHFRADKITLGKETEEYISKKVSVFEKYIDKNDTSADLYVEVGKTTEHHKSGEIFRSEFNLHVAGKELRSEAEAADLRSSVDAAIDKMVEELRTEKDKDTTMFRRGARELKNILRRINPMR